MSWCLCGRFHWIDQKKKKIQEIFFKRRPLVRTGSNIIFYYIQLPYTRSPFVRQSVSPLVRPAKSPLVLSVCPKGPSALRRSQKEAFRRGAEFSSHIIMRMEGFFHQSSTYQKMSSLFSTIIRIYFQITPESRGKPIWCHHLIYTHLISFTRSAFLFQD